MNIAEIVRENLRQSELYLDTQQVMVSKQGENIEINWYPRGQQVTYSEEWPAHAELEITGTTCKLLRMAIDKEHRGKGHGKKLCIIIENIARELGCNKITAEPTGETIEAYMARLGYTPKGPIMEKLLT